MDVDNYRQYMYVAIQTKLELESVKSGGTTGELPAVGDEGGELQAALQLVAELQRQLESVREETAEKEKRLQDEVQRLSGVDYDQEKSTGQL